MQAVQRDGKIMVVKVKPFQRNERGVGYGQAWVGIGAIYAGNREHRVEYVPRAYGFVAVVFGGGCFFGPQLPVRWRKPPKVGYVYLVICGYGRGVQETTAGVVKQVFAVVGTIEQCGWQVPFLQYGNET